MSKMDNLRAMREARYEKAAAAGSKKAAVARRPAAEPAPSAPEVPEPAAGPTPAPAEGLCGHRAISGKTCTREQGHAEKSHRYA
jgi:hypothetical protein